jgi:hypothetical protein
VPRPRLISLLAISFLFGAVAATVYDSVAQVDPSQRHRRHSSRKLMEDLTQELDLDAVQTPQIQIVLDEGAEQLKSFSRQVKQDYRSIRSGTYDRLREILSEDQIEQFNAIVEKRRNERRQNKKQRSD